MRFGRSRNKAGMSSARKSWSRLAEEQIKRMTLFYLAGRRVYSYFLFWIVMVEVILILFYSYIID